MIRRTVLSLALALAAAPAFADSPTKLLRFPDIHGDRIAFVHAGDIYVVNAAGGTAQRLTSGEGAELYPKFSPDGSRIAFSAEYNGTRQVYVMPAAGGAPTQLTWYNDIGAQPPRGGTDYRVLDWTPDGRNVVVRANRNPSGNRDGRPYLVPADGGMETPMPIPESGGGMLSPDGTKFVYTPIDREFRTWKRYRGGRAQDVWVYDLAADTSLQLTADRATDQQPMWVGDTVYFVSDRNDTRLNLYAVAPTGGEAVMLAHVSYPAVAPEPAGYAPQWLEILRGEMGFAGVAFSDDIGMAAAHSAGGVAARIDAHLDAGCDLVLVCHPELVPDSLAAVAGRGRRFEPAPLLGRPAPAWDALAAGTRHAEARARFAASSMHS